MMTVVWIAVGIVVGIAFAVVVVTLLFFGSFSTWG